MHKILILLVIIAQVSWAQPRPIIVIPSIKDICDPGKHRNCKLKQVAKDTDNAIQRLCQG